MLSNDFRFLDFQGHFPGIKYNKSNQIKFKMLGFKLTESMRVVDNKLTESMRVVDNKLTESMRVVGNKLTESMRVVASGVATLVL